MPLERYPLCWPAGWRRISASQRKNGQFNKKEPVYRDGRHLHNATRNLTVADGVERILDSLERMGVDRQEIIISTNVRVRLDGLPRSGEKEPDDPGAAVYWRETNNSPMRCMAIDRYTTVADNLAAIGATLEAMRAIERHGGAEILDRAFTGFAALPASTEPHWSEVLDLPADATADQIQTSFRSLARTAHPDAGGSAENMQRLNMARDRALAERSA